MSLKDKMMISEKRRVFNYSPLSFVPIVNDDTPNGRYYEIPTGEKFPSVTTVLSRVLDNSKSLDKWRERVGEEEANRVSNRAKFRGSTIHSLAESYLSNDPDYKKKVTPVNLETFNKIKPILDEHIGLIMGIELPLYSHHLHTAGRTDLLAEYDGRISIIDFKTSKKSKDSKDILSYFLQATAYGEMVEERYPKILVPQIVIVISVDHDQTQTFVRERIDYKEQMVRVFTEGKL